MPAMQVLQTCFVLLNLNTNYPALEHKMLMSIKPLGIFTKFRRTAVKKGKRQIRAFYSSQHVSSDKQQKSRLRWVGQILPPPPPTPHPTPPHPTPPPHPVPL